MGGHGIPEELAADVLGIGSVKDERGPLQVLATGRRRAAAEMAEPVAWGGQATGRRRVAAEMVELAAWRGQLTGRR